MLGALAKLRVSFHLSLNCIIVKDSIISLQAHKASCSVTDGTCKTHTSIELILP